MISHNKNFTMKTSKKYLSLLTLLALFFFTTSVSAQYDDLYDDDSESVQFENSDEEYIEDYDGDDYDYYNVDEKDGHYYSSRVRRFARAGSSIGYYSPIYTGAGFYGAGFNNGFNNRSILNRRNVGFGNSINPYYNPYARSITGAPIGFGNGFVGNGFGGGGFAGSNSAFYCPPVGGTFAPSSSAVNGRAANTVGSSRNSGSVINSTATRTGRTTTTRTGRDFRSSTPRNTSVRTERTRSSRPTSTRTSSRSFNSARSNNSTFRSPRSSSARSNSTRSSNSVRSSIRSSSSRSSGGSSRSSSSRGSRG